MDVHGVDGQDVVREDDEVRQLAHLDAALDVVLMGGVGGVQGVAADGLPHADGLGPVALEVLHPVVAVYRSVDDLDAHRAGGGVGVQSHMDPGVQHAADSLKIPVALRAVELREVLAQHLDHAGVDNRADVHLRHTLNKVRVHDDAVLDAVAQGADPLRVLPEAALIALHHELDGQVPHRVGGALALGVVDLLDVVPGFLPVPTPLPGKGGIVGVGLPGGAGGAAGAAVDHEFAGAHPEMLVAEAGHKAQLQKVLVVLQGEGLAEDGVQGHIGPDPELPVPAEFLHGVVGGGVALAHVAHRGDAVFQAFLLGL